ncbi:MAG: hypothetical protein IIA88_04910 [Bacteroidetes bacterium]|nr:hypothetical protein [Bacteroidota bacterium]
MELLLKILIILPLIPWTVVMVCGIKHFLLVKKAYNNHVYTEREKSYFDALYRESTDSFNHFWFKVNYKIDCEERRLIFENYKRAKIWGILFLIIIPIWFVLMIILY